MALKIDLFIPRIPWPDHFPDVILHTTLENRDHHPDYMAAKSGDKKAALNLTYDLLDLLSIDQIKQIIENDSPIITPVTAIETTGYNAIPDAMAGLLLSLLNCEYYPGNIYQSNKVAHTRAKGFWRFVTPPTFDGEVLFGRNYFLVDDHIGHGGTLANLRGFIEYHGGKVIGISTLTETTNACQIRLGKSTYDMLLLKHGEKLEQYWKTKFGYGLDCLTNVEAGFLARQSSFDSIREGLAQAASEVRASGLFAINTDD